MWYQNEDNQKYDEDNYISNFGCPPTTKFPIQFCYPDMTRSQRFI